MTLSLVRKGEMTLSLS